MKYLHFFLLPLLLPSFASAGVLEDYPTYLVSYWDFDESSGVRYDLHGSNDLTDNNTVGSAVAQVGNGALFARSSSEYLSIPDASQMGLDFNDSFSCVVIVDLQSALSSYANEVIFAKYDFNTPQQSYSVDLLPSTGSGDRVRLITSSTGSNNSQMTVATGQSFGTDPFMLTVTYDATTQTFETFIDGSSAGTATGAHSTIFNSTASFYVGSFSVSPPDALLDATLDELFCLDNYVLDSTEVASLYDSGNYYTYTSSSTPPETPSLSVIPASGINLLGTTTCITTTGTTTCTYEYDDDSLNTGPAIALALILLLAFIVSLGCAIFIVWIYQQYSR